jgi:hypothetical protein
MRMTMATKSENRATLGSSQLEPIAILLMRTNGAEHMPKFSKRHYTAIANVLRTAQEDPDASLFTPIEAIRIADLMSRAFAKDNARFDRDLFLRAAGVVKPIAPVMRRILDRVNTTIVNSERER